MQPKSRTIVSNKPYTYIYIILSTIYPNTHSQYVLTHPHISLGASQLQASKQSHLNTHSHCLFKPTN